MHAIATTLMDARRAALAVSGEASLAWPVRDAASRIIARGPRLALDLQVRRRAGFDRVKNVAGIAHLATCNYMPEPRPIKPR
jgi:hypothetical protein